MKAPSEAESPSPSSGNKIKRLWFPLVCVGLLGFEMLWQVNLILYQKDLVLPLLLTILSIPFGLLLFSIGNRLLLIASGQTELMDPRIVNQDILPKDADISEFVKIDLPPEPVSASRGDGASDQKESLFIRNLALIRNLMGILIGCALFFWVMNLWGLDLPLGRSVVQSALSIFATLLLAYVVWAICRTIIDRMLEADRPQSEQDMDDMEEGTEGSRKGTLLTLLRKVIFALIGVIVILITLSAVGINIGPLLAGAGILGIAVGFGSQTLVRDILSGVFFLMDDSAMILRVKFKTKPGDQFVVRREVYRRIQERFGAEGIEFAHRNVTVYLPPEVTETANGDNFGEDTVTGGRPNKKLIEAGAAAAIAVSQAEEVKKKPDK